jgi:hypothetical protein
MASRRKGSPVLRRRLLLIRHWIKVLTMYRTMQAYYQLVGRYHRMRAEYWRERMFLNYYARPVVVGLASLARTEMDLIKATRNMVLPWAKGYRSHRKRWLSATLHEQDYLHRAQGDNTQT